MDELKISSKFTRGILSKILESIIAKKLGYMVDIQLQEIQATITDEKAHVHLCIDADMSIEELKKFKKLAGLD